MTTLITCNPFALNYLGASLNDALYPLPPAETLEQWAGRTGNDVAFLLGFLEELDPSVASRLISRGWDAVFAEALAMIGI